MARAISEGVVTVSPNKVRRSVDAGAAGCSFCGGVNHDGTIYNYGTVEEAGFTKWERKSFCSKSCRELFFS